MALSRSLRWTLPLCSLFVTVATGCDSSVEPSAVTSSPIIGGSRDLSDSAVVAIQQSSTGTLCSGVVVAPDLVLTAAHCVFGVAASDLQVLVGPIVMTPTQTVAVTRTATYPTYQGESEGLAGGVDLAFLTLATPLAITPIPVRTDASGAEFDETDVTVVGYGASDGTDNSGTGFRRQVVLQISQVCSRLLRAGGADANVCVGDSGGAVLVGGELVAIVSGGEPGCYALATFTRTDAHADWVRAALGGRPLTTCPDCVEPDPSCTAPTETGDDGGTGDAAAPAASSGPSAHGWSCSVMSGRSGSGALGAGLVIVLAASLARRRTLRARAAASPRR